MNIPLEIISLVLIIVYFVPSYGQTKSLNFTHHVSLPSGLLLKWKTDDPEWITFEMSGPTRGYIAVGFSPTGDMVDSDIYLGWVDSKGNGHLRDYFATSNAEPLEDQKQDLEMILASEDENGTSVTFRRRWDTCDHNDFIIGDDTMRLIWAWSEEDPIEFNGATRLPYHGHDVLRRGSRSTFIKTSPKPRKFPDEEELYPEDVKHVDLTVSNIKVPKMETYYHCKIVKFPKLSEKHHIIAYRPLISEDIMPHIHHINVYQCHIPEFFGFKAEDIFEKYVDHPGGECYTPDSPKEWIEYCFEFRVAVGVGSEGDILPDHLGDVIGASNAPSYYRLEVHYENPNGKYLLDSSGIRIFYTKKLRRYETSVLFTGHRRTPFLTIPPRQKEFTISGFCSAECTKYGLPSEGIKIVSVLLHAHLTGRKIILRHIRKGRELPPIAFDKNFDFNYQHYRVLPKEIIVLPGDELITECTYDTSTNNSFVFGGLSTRREMCESFIVYYPKSALTDCRSQPELFQYLGALGIMNATGEIFRKLNLPFDPKNLPENLQNVALPDDSLVLEMGSMYEVNSDVFKDVLIQSPVILRNRDVHDHMTSLNWNDDYFTKLVEKKWRNGPHYMHCAASGGQKIQGSHVVGFPKFIDYMDTTPKNKCLMRVTNDAAYTNHPKYSSRVFAQIIFAFPLIFRNLLN